MKKVLIAALVCCALTACQDTRFVFSNQVPAEPSYSRTQHYTFWGKKSTIEVAKVCGSMDNVAMVEQVENSGQSWLRWLTVGIYTPMTARVYCKRPTKSDYRAQQPKE